MKITKQQWSDISEAYHLAHNAVENLELLLLTTTVDHKDDSAEAQKLNELREKVKLATESLSGMSYMTHPQCEWTGGDSSDPKNFKTREPHIVGLQREYIQ